MAAASICQMERDNLTEAEAEQRIKSQKSDEFYEKHSDIVIKNDGDKIDVYKILENII